MRQLIHARDTKHFPYPSDNQSRCPRPPVICIIIARHTAEFYELEDTIIFPDSVKLDVVRRELPHGEVTVHAVNGGLRSPTSDTLIACAAITVSVEYPQDASR